MAPYEVISIDVFDTLLARRVRDPEMVHVVVARQYFQDREGRAGWPLIRARAEQDARHASSAPDVTLSEIYRAVENVAPNLDVDALQSLEMATEAQVVVATRRGKMLWQAAFWGGKRIVVNTDIYLPRSHVESLLRNCGYLGWSELYVSGDDRTSKHDGTSFARLEQEFPASAVLHIGDNARSDVASAQAAGVDAMHLVRPLEVGPIRRSRVGTRLNREMHRRRGDLPTLQRSIRDSLVESWLDRASAEPSQLERIGYEVLGPALVGFSQYLETQAAQGRQSRLVFLAREGAMMKRAFDTYTTRPDVQTEYAVISTRLLGIARLSAALSDADMQFLTKSPVPLTAERFVRRVLPGVDQARIDRLLHDHKIPAQQRLGGTAAESALRPVFQDLAPELAELGSTRRDVTSSYLQSLAVADEGTAIVDVGWQGTIQRAISSLLGRPVAGTYWGLRRTPLTLGVGGIGAWVDQRRGGVDASLFSPLFRFAPTLEILLANPDVGSAAGVDFTTERAGAAQPQFAFSYLPSEFSDADGNRIRLLQDAAIEFVADSASLRGTFDAETLTIDKRSAHRWLIRLLTRPSVAQLDGLKSISFDGTYGVSPQQLGNWWIPPELRPNR